MEKRLRTTALETELRSAIKYF